MSRPSDWSPLDRWSDPVPGEPSEVRKHAAHYTAVADAIADAAARLQAIADYQTSQSKFVDEFRSKASRVASDIIKAQTRYASVGTATAGYATPLENAQNDADAALVKARTARDEADSAQVHIQHYQQELAYNTALTEQEKQDYTTRLHQYQSDHGNYEQIITAAKNSLQQAIDDRDKAAERAIGLISDTEDSNGLSDSGWDQFWDKYGKEIVDVLSIVATVALIVIAFIPVLGEIEFLLTVIILSVVAVVTILNNLTQMNTGKMSALEGWSEIALSLIPIGGAGAMHMLGERAVETVGEAAVRTGMTSAAGRAIPKFTRDVETTLVKGVERNALKPSPLNVLKVAFSEGAKDTAKMQAVAEMALTKSGASERVAGIAHDVITKLPFMPGPGLEYGVEHGIIDPALEKLGEK